MRNGRFHPSKCRNKVQNMGVLYTHFPKIVGPFLTIPFFTFLKSKIGKKAGIARSLSDYMLQPVGNR
jgi:hypothetical protein